MTISQRIFEELKKQGKKQKDLAEHIGISTSAVSDWKKKGTNPASENIYAIADFLNVSTDYILTGNERTPLSKSVDISNSTVGTVVGQSSGTITINSNTLEDNEIANEILRIVQSLPLKERSKLIGIIYDFEEEYIKSK